MYLASSPGTYIHLFLEGGGWVEPVDEANMYLSLPIQAIPLLSAHTSSSFTSTFTYGDSCLPVDKR